MYQGVAANLQCLALARYVLVFYALLPVHPIICTRPRRVDDSLEAPVCDSAPKQELHVAETLEVWHSKPFAPIAAHTGDYLNPVARKNMRHWLPRLWEPALLANGQMVFCYCYCDCEFGDGDWGRRCFSGQQCGLTDVEPSKHQHDFGVQYQFNIEEKEPSRRAANTPRPWIVSQRCKLGHKAYESVCEPLIEELETWVQNEAMHKPCTKASCEPDLKSLKKLRKDVLSSSQMDCESTMFDGEHVEVKEICTYSGNPPQHSEPILQRMDEKFQFSTCRRHTAVQKRHLEEKDRQHQHYGQLCKCTCDEYYDQWTLIEELATFQEDYRQKPFGECWEALNERFPSKSDYYEWQRVVKPNGCSGACEGTCSKCPPFQKKMTDVERLGLCNTCCRPKKIMYRAETIKQDRDECRGHDHVCMRKGGFKQISENRSLGNNELWKYREAFAGKWEPGDRNCNWLSNYAPLYLGAWVRPDCHCSWNAVFERDEGLSKAECLKPARVEEAIRTLEPAGRYG